MTGTILKYPGSKVSLAGWINEHLPSRYDRYLEPYFGSGAVFFARAPVRKEIVNDIDGAIQNLFRVVRRPDTRAELIEAVGFTPFSEEELQVCSKPYIGDDPVERSRRLLVVAWMGISARRRGKPHFRYTAGGTSNEHPPMTWSTLPDRIRFAGERLAKTAILRRDAIKVIRSSADSRTLIYADPPYLRSTRSQDYYLHEVTDEHHERLLAALKAHPGAVVISGYDSDLYQDALTGWRRSEIPGRAQRTTGKKEVLWSNNAAWLGCRASRHIPLFEGEFHGA